MQDKPDRVLPVLEYPRADPRGRWRIDTDPLLAPQMWWTQGLAAPFVLLLLWELRFPPALSDGMVLSMLAILLVTVYWGVRFGLMLILSIVKRARPHPLREHWRRWTIIPLLFVFSIWSVRSDWPSRFVFYLHRNQMQQIAQQVLAGQTLTVPQRVGMYEFQRIERVGSAVSFYESRGSWGFWFNYSPSRTNGNLGGPWSASSHD